MEHQLRAYLESVGIVDGITSCMVECEVCGGTDCDILVREVEDHAGSAVALPVVACVRCGFVYQNPRFNKAFYDTYYDKHYRLMLSGDARPEKDFLIDQVRRGEILYRNLGDQLPGGGRLLDVGCSAGGLMVAFARRGWSVFGTDPDSDYAECGRQRFGLEIQSVAAEDMRLRKGEFDLIIITGSLEHVFDVNRVLSICRCASKPDGQLLIEGRAFGYGVQQGHFSHNHRRYLTLRSIELLMLKHGWAPVRSTSDPLCGPTRPGAVFVLGRAAPPLSGKELLDEIARGRRDEIVQLRQSLAGLKGRA